MNVVTDMPKVSVLCVTYNHEKFIRQTLEGFVMQKTSFLFEVLIHDDASTDKTVEIIEEYVTKYPKLFRTVFQTENQHSKGVIATVDILLPMAQGKYIAICEGDDYWCDESKLQKQFDYMEQHNECALCVHNTKIHYLNSDLPDALFHRWNSLHVMSEDDIFFGWNVHTTSYFMRKENMYRPKFARFWAGDYAMLTLNYDKGSIVSLPDVMSVYNANNPAGITYQNANLKPEMAIKKMQERANYLKKYNEYTEYRHKEIVDERIKEIELSCLICAADYKLNNSKDYADLKKTAKEICKNAYYVSYINRCDKKRRMKLKVKYGGHIWGYLWYFLILLNQMKHLRK